MFGNKRKERKKKGNEERVGIFFYLVKGEKRKPMK